MGRDTDFNPEEFDYRTEDPPTYQHLGFDTCTKLVVCTACGHCHGDCNIIRARMEEELINRAPRTNGNQQQRGNQQRGPQTGLPPLNTDKLTYNKQPAKILGARTENDPYRDGQQIVKVKVLLNTNTFMWTVRSNNPCLTILCDHLGDDETQWQNADILLFNEQDEFDNKTWLRVDFPEPNPNPAQAGKGKTRR